MRLYCILLCIQMHISYLYTCTQNIDTLVVCACVAGKHDLADVDTYTSQNIDLYYQKLQAWILLLSLHKL